MNSFVSLDRTKSRRRALAVIADFVELTKPRIAAMVLLTVVVAGYLVAGGTLSIVRVFHVAVGVLLISASGSAWNQYLERYTDFLMPRTAFRPLPDRRLSAQQVAMFGAITFGMGMAYLGAVVGTGALLLGLATWCLYVLVYTPLKRLTWWNTAVGAVAGGMPVLIGAWGAGGQVSPLAWALFGILFLWQFPHFMAIAWLYRRDYAEGKLKMVTVVDSSGALAAWHAIVTAGALLGLSIATAWCFPSTASRWVVATVGCLAGLWYLRSSIHFARHRDDVAARKLLRVSLMHLPILLLALVVGRILW